MRDDADQLKQRIAALEQEVATLKKRSYPYLGIRKRSDRYFWGLPLYDIALGPDPTKGELRGFGLFVAVGDGLFGKEIIFQLFIESGILSANPFQHHGRVFLFLVPIVGEDGF